MSGLRRRVVGRAAGACGRWASTSSPLGRQNALEEATVGQFHRTPEGEGDLEGSRTRLSSVAQEMEEARTICVKGFSNMGFRLSSGEFLWGPLAVFPRLALSWRVQHPDLIDEDSLEFLSLLQPRPDILVIGVGDKFYLDKTRHRIAPILRHWKLKHEILQTEDAINVYNIVAHEGRYAAALLMPPDVVRAGRRDSWKLSEMIGYDPLDTVHSQFNIFLGEEPDKRVSYKERIARGDLVRNYIYGGTRPNRIEPDESDDEDTPEYLRRTDPHNIFKAGEVADVSKPMYGSVLKEEKEKERRRLEAAKTPPDHLAKPDGAQSLKEPKDPKEPKE